MNAPATNLPAERREVPPLVKLNNQLIERAEQFKMVLPSHISPEKLQRTVMTAAQQNPALMRADRQSLMMSCMKAAQDGLLPDGREAALVPFITRVLDKDTNQWVSRELVQYMPMVYGLRKKILQSGEIRDFATKVVYLREVQEGAFLYEEGTEAMLRHKPLLDLTEEDCADKNIILAYSIATFANGTKSYEVMRRFEIDKVRECSQTGATRDKKGKPREAKGPWVDWFPEQCKKTVMRRHSKTLPMSGDLIIDVEGRELDAAMSTMALLDSTEANAPVALPPLDTFEDGGETVEADTGLVLPSKGDLAAEEKKPAKKAAGRGMTEVDEETARALDAGANAAEEVEEQAGEDEKPAWADTVHRLLGGIRAAKNETYLAGIEDEYLGCRDYLPADIVADIDEKISAKREAWA